MIAWIKNTVIKISLRRRKIQTSGAIFFRALGSAQVNVDEFFVFGPATLGYGSDRRKESHLIIENGGRLNVGSATIGRGSKVIVRENASITIGNGSYLSDNCFVSIATQLSIGSGCFISWDIQIIDDDGHQVDDKPMRKPITIHDNVWIGSRATILKGTVLGKGCMVAAGAVVSGTFPENCLVAGVPARVIRENIRWK